MTQKISKKPIKSIALTALIIAGGVTIFYAGAHFSANPQQAGQAPQGLPVTAVQLKAEEIQQSIILPGRITAIKEAQVRPQVSGIITEILFKQGKKVTKGDQLYQIDPKPFEVTFNAAQAELKKAQAKEVRFKELLKLDAVSQQEYDDAYAALAQAKANLDIAKVNLDYTKVYAPINGYAGKTDIPVGALVNANQAEALTSITQLDPVYADLSISAEEYLKIRSQFNTESPLSVNITNGDNVLGSGIVNFAETTVNETTGTVTIRATIQNPEKALLPGMFVRAQVNLLPQQAILVPHRAAVRTPAGNLTVWQVNSSNEANPTPIQTSGSYNNAWITTSGVTAGDTIVTEGLIKLSAPGTKVMPTPNDTNK